MISNKFYYDGTLNLSAIHVSCDTYTTYPMACVHNSNCGWCGQTNKCIEGNRQGPKSPCIRSTFLYTAPTPEWNPFKAGTINILAVDKQGKPMTTTVPEPNMSKAYIDDPYKLSNH